MTRMSRKVVFRDLGLIDYKECWDYQERLFNEIISQKLANRNLSPELQLPTASYLLFCEHPHVYTLGKSGSEDHLLLNEKELIMKNAVYYKINRGGDITYHGPGQLVGYPIFDLDNFFTDIHRYLRCLEEAIILTLQEYDVPAGRVEGLTGVWIDPASTRARKIAAMGVKSSRWVTMHGFAFNINCDLTYFDNIIPCGITDKAVTSLYKELNKATDIREVKHKLKANLAAVFDLELE